MYKALKYCWLRVLYAQSYLFIMDRSFGWGGGHTPNVYQ